MNLDTLRVIVDRVIAFTKSTLWQPHMERFKILGADRNDFPFTLPRLGIEAFA